MEMIEDAVRLLDHLGIERAHVVGYSGGFKTNKLREAIQQWNAAIFANNDPMALAAYQVMRGRLGREVVRSQRRPSLIIQQPGSHRWARGARSA